MAKRSKEELLASVNALLGENISDEALTFIEDLSDSVDVESDSVDWKAKYAQLDADWRKRYKERFMGTSTTPEEVVTEQEENVEEDGEKRSYEELFEEREG